MSQAQPKPRPPRRSEAALHHGIELLFYAYRDFTAEADAILARLGFGRAHHRAIYFIGRYPGIRVGELLAILRITKQSLARVLGQLVRSNYVSQAIGPDDRRERLLSLTERGTQLERRLGENQRARMAAAFEAAGETATEGFKHVLLNLIAEDDRAKLAREPGPANITILRPR